MIIWRKLSIIIAINLLHPLCFAKLNKNKNVLLIQNNQLGEVIESNGAIFKFKKVQQYLNPDKSNNFQEITNFINKNPYWPFKEALKKAAEKSLKDSDSPRLVVNWFNANPPTTSQGFRFYALAAANIFNSNDPSLPQIIKNGYIYGDLTRQEQNYFQRKFQRHLTVNDHAKLIDHLIRSGKIDDAKLLLSLAGNYKNSLKTYIEIVKHPEKTASLFNQVNSKYYTPGLIYNYLNSQKKNQSELKNLITLFKFIPIDDHYYCKDWTRLRIYYSRELIQEGQYLAAYQVIAAHQSTEAYDPSEAEWLAGWIAMKFLHKPNHALKHFHKMQKIVKQPVSLARATYWLGRASQANKDSKSAIEYYSQASNYSFTYYGHLAAYELKKKDFNLPIKPKISAHHHQKCAKNELLQVAEYLLYQGDKELAKNYAKAAMEYAESDSEVLLILNKIYKKHDLNYLTEGAKFASQNHVFILDYAFPTPYNIKQADFDIALVYSIMRQESVFDSKAISTATAKGLMQLMDKTACDVAKSIGTPCNVKKLTQDPHYNIKLGAEHLKQLLEKYNGSYILAIPAYNAGSHNVKKWIKLNGDPRTFSKAHDIIDWIELIPFSETRTYVQRVIENLQIYRTIIHKDNKLNIFKDLTRGKL